MDASALVAMLFVEPEAGDLSKRLEAAGGGMTSPLALFEATAALMRRPTTRAQSELEIDELLQETNISIVPITPEIGCLALVAFERYGKGRGHPAQLNMGDCFAYACAQSLGMPLLYKGDDFSRTDLA